MKYLVTGADGFIGSHLVRRLASRGETIAIVHSADTLSRLKTLARQVSIRPVDIRDADQVRETVMDIRPTAVFHLAAATQVSERTPAVDLVAVNVLGAYNLLAAIRAAGTVERAVFVGSWYEYGSALGDGPDRFPRPTSPYGVSKLAATLLAQSLALRTEVPAVVVRPFQVYGPAEPPHRLLPQIFRSAREGVPVRLQNPSSLRDWVFVDDVVDAMEAALQSALGGAPADVGTGIVTPVGTVARMAADLVGGTIVDDEPISRPDDVVVSDATLSGAADTRATERLFGWTAKCDLASGLRKTIDAHIQEHGPIGVA